jgi:hypothetical protein
MVRWFGDLTCDLWAENGERKMVGGITTLDSASWDFVVCCAAHVDHEKD